MAFALALKPPFLRMCWRMPPVLGPTDFAWGFASALERAAFFARICLMPKAMVASRERERERDGEREKLLSFEAVLLTA